MNQQLILSEILLHQSDLIDQLLTLRRIKKQIKKDKIKIRALVKKYNKNSTESYKFNPMIFDDKLNFVKDKKPEPQEIKCIAPDWNCECKKCSDFKKELLEDSMRLAGLTETPANWK